MHSLVTRHIHNPTKRKNKVLMSDFLNVSSKKDKDVKLVLGLSMSTWKGRNDAQRHSIWKRKLNNTVKRKRRVHLIRGTGNLEHGYNQLEEDISKN